MQQEVRRPGAHQQVYYRRSSTVRRAALVATSALMLAGCEIKGGFHGIELDPPKPVPGFQFTRADGSIVRTDAESGRPQLFFFGYTHCPDVCPTTLADWKRLKEAIGDRSSRVRFFFVTVDPERDTPAISERYATQFDSAFAGVSGDSLTTARIKDAFGVAAYHEGGTEPSGYFVSHSSQVFLVDGKGRIVAQYPFGIGWEALRDDLKRFL